MKYYILVTLFINFVCSYYKSKYTFDTRIKNNNTFILSNDNLKNNQVQLYNEPIINDNKHEEKMYY